MHSVKGGRTIFDAANSTLAVVDPLSNRTTSIYDVAKSSHRFQECLGKSVHDDTRRLQSNHRVGRSSIESNDILVLNGASQQIQVKDANGKITTTVFDAAGRTVATINAVNFRTTQLFECGRASRIAPDRRLEPIEPVLHSITAAAKFARRIH